MGEDLTVFLVVASLLVFENLMALLVVTSILVAVSVPVGEDLTVLLGALSFHSRVLQSVLRSIVGPTDP